MNSIMPSAVCSHYSTIGVAESRRFEYWNDVVLRHCIPAASVPMAGVDFDARLAVRGWGWWISVRCPRRCTAGNAPHVI
jgi:hypothetical protein